MIKYQKLLIIYALLELLAINLNAQVIGDMFVLNNKKYILLSDKWHKLDDNIGAEIIPNRIVVHLKDENEAIDYEISNFISSDNISIYNLQLSGWYLVSVLNNENPFTIATYLENTDKFDIIEFDMYGKNADTPNDPYFVSQWNLHQNKINMEFAWTITKGDNAVIVGIVDSGIKYDHEDLDSNIWVNPEEDINDNGKPDYYSITLGGDIDSLDNDGNEFIDDLIGWNFAESSNEIISNYHGTGVAGIIAAQTNNFEDGQYRGVAGIAGGWAMNNGVRLMNVIDIKPDFGLSLITMSESINYAVNNGAMVINVSQGLSSNSDYLEASINYAHSNDVIVVCAAGNDGNHMEASDNLMNYPARYSKTISVGATIENDDRWIGSAKKGSMIGDDMHPLDLMAPGAPDTIWTTQYNGGYQKLGKTSAATPHVSGTIALMLSINDNLIPNSVKEILHNTADKVEGMNGLNYTHEYGYGRLNAYQAVLMALAYANKSTVFYSTAYNSPRTVAFGKDSPSMLHEVFRSGTKDATYNGWEIFYRNSSSGGASWSGAERVSDGNGDNFMHCLAVTDEGSADAIHVVWQQKKSER